ncbi:MAG: NUDIX domain-containing protein [Bacteroidetes bacterium]|nr:MAG: NUDIX domain-containing protein [Bacteroidota bacterium]
MADMLDQLSIDCLIFGFGEGQLRLLLISREDAPAQGQWALPGGFILRSESIDDASRRILRQLTGLQDLYLAQLRAFGAVDRYPPRRVVTLAYYALISADRHPLTSHSAKARWFPVTELPALPFDHEAIFQEGMATLRRNIRHQPVGFELLPEKFTLLQLQQLYEAILGLPLDKPNFRRKLTRMDLLIPLPEYQREVAHRAARLYRFDKDRYDRLCEEGFVFEVAPPRRERKTPDR